MRTVEIIIDNNQGITPALIVLFATYLLGSKTLEIFFTERLHLLHILVEAFIVNAILETL